MNKKKFVFYLSLLMLLCTIIISTWNYKGNKEYILDEVSIKNDAKIKNKNLAIMIQKEDESGYEESDTFLTGYELNISLSGCMNADGYVINDAIEYNSDTMNLKLKSNGSSYCYLYFDIIKNTYFSEYLLENPTTGLNTALEGGLYRYQGASGTVNNYVCFGTSDKDTCLENTDAHMYRIIGIAEDGKVKLIKNEALNSKIQWYNDDTINTGWKDSIIYSTIISETFLENEMYVSSDWKNKLAIISWKYGSNNVVNRTASALYDIENAWTNTVDAKVGLMYAHDYAYAYQSGGLNCTKQSDNIYLNCFASWIHLSKCDDSAPSSAEWTMSRYGQYNSNNYVWSIQSGGYFSNLKLSTTYSVRPVFYLISDIQLIGGTGTIDNPFIIQ